MKRFVFTMLLALGVLVAPTLTPSRDITYPSLWGFFKSPVVEATYLPPFVKTTPYTLVLAAGNCTGTGTITSVANQNATTLTLNGIYTAASSGGSGLNYALGLARLTAANTVALGVGIASGSCASNLAVSFQINVNEWNPAWVKSMSRGLIDVSMQTVNSATSALSATVNTSKAMPNLVQWVGTNSQGIPNDSQDMPALTLSSTQAICTTNHTPGAGFAGYHAWCSYEVVEFR